MPFTPEQLDQEVLYIVHQHVGKDYAINRWDFVEKIYGEPVSVELRNDANVQDREIRFSIERLREDGHLICDLGNGQGRYIPANENEFWEFYNWYLAPVRSRNKKLCAMKKSAAQRWPNVLQMNLFELESA